jgi:hypothetical protein
LVHKSKQRSIRSRKTFSNARIGVDAIPDFIKESKFFDGNDLGKLGNIETLPTEEEINIFVKNNVAVKGVLSSMILKKFT